MDHSQDSSKRARIFGKTVALALVILGLLCLLGVWIPVTKHYFKEGVEPFDIIFLFIVPIPVTIFAGYCLVVAGRLCKSLTKESLRNICFISSLIVFGMLATTAVSILESERSLPKWRMWFPLIELLCMIPAGLFYWLTNKYLTRWLGFDNSIDWQRRKRAVSNFFGLMAFLMFGFFMVFTQSLDETYDLRSSPLFTFGALLLPAILALIFYRLSLRIAMHGCPKNQDQKSQVAEATIPND
jgi:hypothetical protein